VKYSIAIAIVLLTAAIRPATAADVTLAVTDTAARVATPVWLEVDLAELFGRNAAPNGLELIELTGPGKPTGDPIPIQFLPRHAEGDSPIFAPRKSGQSPSSERTNTKGTLWWLMPPGKRGVWQFRLRPTARAPAETLTVKSDSAQNFFDVTEGDLPVLRYNHGTVPVPEGINANYARGEYISPLYGPDGEVLTDDYPRDHPHHRGVGWSWPVTRWKDEVRDIWAVRGVWARPVAIRRTTGGPVVAVIEAESVWKWADQDPIVREEVVIRAFRQVDRCRFVDVEVRLTALADGVAIGGRPNAGYGGFGLRAAPAEAREITAHADPADARPRRAWLDYSGLFAGGKGRAGVTIFEHVTNPDYPGELHQYPDCNYVMPAFPGSREVPLSREKPLVLKHRLWIHPDAAAEKTQAGVWAAYAHRPLITIRTTER